MDTLWHDILPRIILETWLITARMAPFLLLGFLVAGWLSVFIDPAWLERHLGGRGFGSTAKAAMLGVPLPLCSCGVLPVGASLRQHGASRAATTAFLLSTPQTGVDSILVTWTMLGPFFAVFRPLAALLTGLLGGAAVQLLVPDPRPPRQPAVADGDARARGPQRPRGLLPKILAAGRYGLVSLPRDIGRALLLGLILAGLLGALVPPDFLEGYLGHGVVAILVMVAIGIPLYVCATASVPLAAGFIGMGASPGAALAFLIAGPATNAAALTTLTRVLGRRTTVIFLVTVAVSAVGGGLLLDWLLPRVAQAVPSLAGGVHHHPQVGWWEHLCGVLLAGVMTWAWWTGLRRNAPAGEDGCHPILGAGEAAVGGAADQRLEFAIGGMNCSHCSGSVHRAVMEVAGVVSCRVLLAEGRAVVVGHGLRPEAVIAAVSGLGFSARLLA